MNHVKVYKNEYAPNATLRITLEQIRHSVQCSLSDCAIAMAVQVAFPWATHIKVSASHIAVSDPRRDRRYMYFITNKGSAFVLAWDYGRRNAAGDVLHMENGKPFEPFTISLQNGIVKARGARARGPEDSPARIAARKRHAIRAKARRAAGIKPVPSGIRKTREFGLCKYVPHAALAARKAYDRFGRASCSKI